MIGTFRYLGLDPSICLAKNFRISMKIYENCILNDDILQGMPHAARQLVTTRVRMLPCFPRVGDGADYGTCGPQTNGRIPLDPWIMAQGPSALVAQRTGEVHGRFKSKGKRVSFLKIHGSAFLKKWYRIFCRFLSLRSHRHDSVTPSITLLLDAFAALKLLWTLC